MNVLARSAYCKKTLQTKLIPSKKVSQSATGPPRIRMKYLTRMACGFLTCLEASLRSRSMRLTKSGYNYGKKMRVLHHCRPCSFYAAACCFLRGTEKRTCQKYLTNYS